MISKDIDKRLNHKMENKKIIDSIFTEFIGFDVLLAVVAIKNQFVDVILMLTKQNLSDLWYLNI